MAPLPATYSSVAPAAGVIGTSNQPTLLSSLDAIVDRQTFTHLNTARDNQGPIVTIPASYGGLDSSPSPGTVAGITLGSVAGFLLLLWLIYTCLNIGNPSSGAASSVGTASVVTRKSRTHRASQSTPREHRHRRRSRATVEVRTSTTARPIVVEEPGTRVETVLMEERRRSMSRGPPPPRVVSVHRNDETEDDDDDEIVVEEEHSPPRRHRSSQRRDTSAYREVRMSSASRSRR